MSVARCIALTRAPTRVLPQAQEKQAKAAEAAGAKAAKELAEKAKKVDDKRPLSFDEMLRTMRFLRLIFQRQADGAISGEHLQKLLAGGIWIQRCHLRMTKLLGQTMMRRKCRKS